MFQQYKTEKFFFQFGLAGLAAKAAVYSTQRRSDAEPLR
jgi:hypothetical protein